MERTRFGGSVIGWIVTAALFGILLGIAVYFRGVTAGWIGFDHDLPGSGPTQELALYAAATLFLGGLLFIVAAATRISAAALATPLLPFAAFAAVIYATARYRIYDPYYYPELHPVAWVMGVPAWTLGILVAIALVAGVVAWRRPRAGLVLEGLALWSVLVWLFFVGPWH